MTVRRRTFAERPTTYQLGPRLADGRNEHILNYALDRNHRDSLSVGQELRSWERIKPTEIMTLLSDSCKKAHFRRTQITIHLANGVTDEHRSNYALNRNHRDSLSVDPPR